MTTRRLAVLTTALGAVLALGACAAPGSTGGGGSSDDASGDGGTTVTVGVVGAGDAHWDVLVDKAAEAGITLELQNFSDYQLPNQALSQGELDANQFQHLQFLAEFNVNTDSDLVPVGATAVYPLGLYSTAHASVEEIPDGGEVAIPNDPTNQARALLVLQEAGLVTLTDGGSSLSTPADIEDSRVTVTPVDAGQTAISLQSVDAAIINNDYVGEADLTPEDSIFEDDPASAASEPYINVWAVQAEDADDETIAQLVELFHDPEVEAAHQEESGGTAVFVDRPASELQEILAGIEENLRAQG
ncbi:NLPA lipoprotein [Beutenbergia cavernae DSM 12333]|uniref:NLPA lipoprotein n=1 Tax=Beutenbergia cavernae (strain ATCC BAA-8 / DSM 12333 / CCUG 43141 / JCM 11478 / NBRC 16432 / NCIMB 13614 / HKI 0122) TaxID=471853 RepID=C5BVV2_BEUC1|nr:MetQ/NlpA family ABC transporter substrate-binding protein [Beutenbergia cavernae]ACQ80553.1 NLPA lipoprotein [Beutenbergia cavernae DSM 12333]